MSVTGRCQKKKCRGKKRCPHRKFWEYDFRLRGKRFRGSIPEARNQEQAERAEGRIKNALFDKRFAGLKAAPGFRKYVETVYEPSARAEKKSWRSDEWRCKILKDHFGDTPLDQIEARDVREFKTAMRFAENQYDRHNSPATVNRLLEILQRILNLGIEDEYLSSNAVSKVGFFAVQKRRPRYFTKAEEARMLERAMGSLAHLRPYLIVGLDAGLRPPSEIFGLKVSDVDLERNVLRAGTKTNVEREIEIRTERLRDALKELCERAEGEYLFVNKFGGQMRCVKNGFAKLLRLAGVPRASSYTMRHTCATRLADEGFNAYQIMAFMGHTSPETSSNYIHLGLSKVEAHRLSPAFRPGEDSGKVKTA